MEEDILTGLGIKVTKQRLAVLEILKCVKKPVTAEEIYDLLEEKDTIHVSTIYRTLSTLAEKGVLTKTGFPGESTYFQLKLHGHTHELECMVCHKHIPFHECPLETFSRVINKENGFVVTEYNLEIKGVCAECARYQDN